MKPDNPSINRQVRYPELDSLRGIAVLVVLFHHYIYDYDYYFNLLTNTTEFSFYRFLQNVLSYGYLGVHLFFIISGFVIYMTLERSKNTLDFVISRISRLYPAYWIAIFITISFLQFLPTPTIGNYSTKEILINMTMLQGFVKIRNVDQVYWTLKLELIFYVIMYVIFISKKLNKIVPICVGWLLLSLCSIYITLPLKKFIDVLLIVEFAPLFIAGILFYKVKQEKNTSTLIRLLILSTFIVETIWMVKLKDADIISVSVLGVIYLIFFVFSTNSLRFLNNKILLFFGSISYSLYLVHNVVGYAIIYRLRETTDNKIIYILVPTVISIVIAYALSILIEKPSMRYIRDRYKSYLIKQGVNTQINTDVNTKPVRPERA